MSLRLRLTLWSSLVVGLVVLAVTALAIYTLGQVNSFLYQPVDENLKRQAKANLLRMSRFHRVEIQQSEDGFGTVFFTLMDPNGQQLTPNQYVPVNETLLQKALAGEETFGTVTQPRSGERARVYMTPIVFADSATGENQMYGVLQAATPLEIPDQIVGSLTNYLLVASVGLVLVAVVGSYVVTGRALRAVSNVTQKAREIETSQDLTRRIPEPRTDDEIGNLARTFNQMLARLDAAFEAQRRFIADSSHELRTPLTVIRGNLHLLRRAQDPQERTRIIAITEAETSRLNRMVNDLLYMAQMQSGHALKPVLRSVELDSLLLEVFSLARSIAALKEQKVVLVHEDIATAHGDRDQIQHLLLNLIDNAVKYTPNGGTISLGLWNDGDWSRIEVSDTGQGIAEADLPMLFERFYRTQDARQNERSGAGLGLAIVKSILDSHNGRIEVFSRVGEGSTFRVWLPKAIPVREVVEVPADRSAVRRRPILTVTGRAKT